MGFSWETLQAWLRRAAWTFAEASAALLGPVALRQWLLERSLPPKQERLRLPGCRGHVEVRFDRWGVPHIYAENAADLFLAQGYCHARDRSWQMELHRRVARGELAELFGEPLVELDRVFRRLGFRRAAEQEAAGLDDELATDLAAYTSGVNAYLERHPPPVEFMLLGQQPRPWHILDTLAFVRYMAWSLSFSWESKLIRHRLVQVLGPEQAAALAPRGSWDLESGTRDSEQRLPAEPGSASDIPHSPLAGGGASNCWVVGLARSTTGRPLLANDPHLRSRMPGIWYVAHLCAGSCNVIGGTIPGIIGVLIGHNDRVAWGVSVACADCQDIFIEQPHPQAPRRFLGRDGWYDAQVFAETITIRGGRSVVEEVVQTRHGPLINGILGIPPDAPPLAFQSTTNSGSCSTRAMLLMNRAGNWTDFRAALSQWTFPALNFVYADVDGTIAYKLAGRVPVRAKGNGLLPVPGWNGEYEWTGEIPFDELPQSVNPAEGILASANSEPDAPCGHFLSHDFIDDNRKRRIVELLQARERHALWDMTAMQSDLVSVAGREAARLLTAVLASARPELAYLADWDGRLDAGSVPASLYEVFRDQLIRQAHVHLPPESLEYVAGKGVSEPLGYLSSVFHHQASSLVLRLLRELTQDDRGLAVIRLAWDTTTAWLRRRLGPEPAHWHWGRLHRIAFRHAIGQGAPMVDRLLKLSRGPYPVGGDADTLAQAGVDPWHPYAAATFTVSYRQVFDVGDWDKGLFVLPSGQSGHPGSRHFADLLPLWRRGQYVPLFFSREAVARETAEVIRLAPAKKQ